jgi:hypothetical protein
MSIDKTYMSIDADAKTVPVSDFRNSTDWLLKCISDVHGCVNSRERARQSARISRAVARVTAQDCNRAKQRDWDRRENAIDRAATSVIAIRERNAGEADELLDAPRA